MKRVLLVVAVAAVVLWLRTAFYTVDFAEFVYVTRFGEPVAVHDGASAAGLKLKAPWPVDSVLRIDRRVQSFDLPAVESLTRDPVNRTVDKTLAVDAFITWQIPDAAAADRFVKVVRTPEQAKKILGPLINGRLAAIISTLPLDDLISVTDVEAGLAGVVGAPAAVGADGRFRAADLKAIDERTERVRRRLLGEESVVGGEPGPGENLRDRALNEYGILILDVRLRRFSYPAAVRDKIAERIRSERAKRVADYESDGRRRAAAITTDANAAARKIEDGATAKKTVIEGEAKAEAARIRGTAYAQDREFGLFVERLQALQMMVGDTRDVLLLSTKHPLFELLRGPPSGMKNDK
ncbi:MAG TPA: SPFH domain-containing protein [Gemmataceae bacterium]|nr:SPFH domain-containing protein [Gemmataceae bacterium]